MPKVCERRLFVPRRAKYYGAIKWTATIMVQGLGAVKDLKRYEIKPHWVPGRCFKDFWRWGKWGEATWRIACMTPRKVCNCFFSGLWTLISIAIHPSLELQAWCVRWDYDRSDWPETVVSQFHLVCDRWDKVSYIMVLSLHHFFALLNVTISFKGITCDRCPSRCIWPASWLAPLFRGFCQVTPTTESFVVLL